MINQEGSAGSALVYVSLKRGLRAKPRLGAAEEIFLKRQHVRAGVL